MKVFFFAAAFALALAVPAASMAGNEKNIPRNNQFGGMATGIVQGLENGDDFSASSTDDTRGTQGGNVVKGNVTKGILQGAYVGDDLDLEMTGGKRNTQGLNVVSGKVTALVGQLGLVEEDIDMTSRGNEKSAQGVNVVNACEECR